MVEKRHSLYSGTGWGGMVEIRELYWYSESEHHMGRLRASYKQVEFSSQRKKKTAGGRVELFGAHAAL